MDDDKKKMKVEQTQQEKDLFALKPGDFRVFSLETLLIVNTTTKTEVDRPSNKIASFDMVSTLFLKLNRIGQ